MSHRKKRVKSTLIAVAALVIIAVLVWQGITAKGNPDPTARNLTPLAAMVDTGILVFREGLETVLVLSAITASLMRSKSSYWKPITTGAGLAYGATLVTWFVVVGIISLVGSTASELDIQAATGLLAIIVLLVVMNWFFHRIYWTGWISFHNRKKQEIIDSIDNTSETNQSIAYKSLVILGFSSVYREGFEVVLFLQNIRMQVGSKVVLLGSSIGLCLTLIVAVLTFIAHRKLPYRKMLVFTGVMLGVVLLVMVGEQAQEMQLAGWIPTTPLNIYIPAWMGLWFAVFPTVETLASQAFAAVFVLGSYFVAEYIRVWRPRRLAANRRV
jgi:high-affinity iron transporter